MNIDLHSVAMLLPIPSAIPILPFDHGWNSEKPAFTEIVSSARDVSLIIEVGTWLGQSAMRMAELHPKAQIICVDHWLGDLNQLRHAQHMMTYGYPSIYAQFLANVARSPHAGRIYPFVQTSRAAARLLHNLGREADLIYIDGTHTSPDVYEDSADYYDLLRPAGMMFGDDIDSEHHPEVRGDVERFVRERGLPLSVRDNFWWTIKPQ